MRYELTHHEWNVCRMRSAHTAYFAVMHNAARARRYARMRFCAGPKR
jgi:hypothetical protein